MEGIQVSVEKTGAQGEISVIRVGGYIDTTTSAELERALDSLLKAGVFRVVIDLNNVDYISSAGWGIFISEIKGIRERGGDLKLARMIPDVYEVFELLEFNYILKAYDSIEEAVRDFEGVSAGPAIIEEEEETEPEEVVSEPEVIEQPAPASVTHTEEKPEMQSPAEQTQKGEGSLEDKIRVLALEHLDWGPGQIVKALNTEAYGNIKTGRLNVWKILRKLHLLNRRHREEALIGKGF